MPHSGSCYRVKFIDKAGVTILSISKSPGRGYNSCQPSEAMQAMRDGDAVIVDGSDMVKLHELCRAEGIQVGE